MKKKLLYILSPLIVIVIIYFIGLVFKPLSKSNKYIENEIASEYKGVIKKKYRVRMCKFDIQTNHKIISVGSLIHKLWDFANEGDSIIKIKGENICIIKRNGQSHTFHYIYYKGITPDSILH